MPRKSFTTKLLISALGFILLIGLLPISSQKLAMQTMNMDEAMTSQMVALQNYPVQASAGDASSMPCCDVMSSFSMVCSFIVSESFCFIMDRGNNRVEYSISVVQSIYIEAVSPPPKA